MPHSIGALNLVVDSSEEDDAIEAKFYQVIDELGTDFEDEVKKIKRANQREDRRSKREEARRSKREARRSKRESQI